MRLCVLLLILFSSLSAYADPLAGVADDRAIAKMLKIRPNLLKAYLALDRTFEEAFVFLSPAQKMELAKYLIAKGPHGEHQKIAALETLWSGDPEVRALGMKLLSENPEFLSNPKAHSALTQAKRYLPPDFIEKMQSAPLPPMPLGCGIEDGSLLNLLLKLGRRRENSTP